MRVRRRWVRVRGFWVDSKKVCLGRVRVQFIYGKTGDILRVGTGSTWQADREMKA